MNEEPSHKSRAERRREEQKRKRIPWDIAIVTIIIFFLICFLYMSHIIWQQKTTFDSLHPHTFDEYAPDDGTDKGLIITPVDLESIKDDVGKAKMDIQNKEKECNLQGFCKEK